MIQDWVPFFPTPFVTQSSATRLATRAVKTTICCISRHVNRGLKQLKLKLSNKKGLNQNHNMLHISPRQQRTKAIKIKTVSRGLKQLKLKVSNKKGPNQNHNIMHILPRQQRAKTIKTKSVKRKVQNQNHNKPHHSPFKQKIKFLLITTTCQL